MKLTANGFTVGPYLLLLIAIVLTLSTAPLNANAQGVILPQDLPQHWRRTTLKEPFYNGNISVVQAGDSAAPALFLIHGLGVNGMLDWLPVISTFESQYHIISIDLPGFGQSDKTVEQLSPARYAELINWVVQQFSDQPVIVAGHSMGGAISLRFAADYPQRVSKLIMLDTAGILQRTIFVRHLAQLPESYQWMEQLGPAKSLFAAALGKFNRFADRVTATVLTGLDHLPDPAQLLLSQPLAQRYLYRDRTNLNAALGLIYEDFSDALASVRVPTHIIWGQQDSVTPLRTGQLLASRMKNAQLHVIDGAGHVPMADAPQQLLAVFQQALQHAPQKTVLADFVASTKDVECKNQRDKVYRGHYRQIRIIGCRYINLQQLTAESVYLENSIVSMQDVRLSSDSTALTLHNAAVTLTNVDLHGKTALHSRNSKVDAAGVYFYGSEHAIRLSENNALYFSVSRIVTPTPTALHGYSLGTELALK